jgi:hypothetical protein
MNISIFKTYVITVESIEICKELIEKELSIVFTALNSCRSPRNRGCPKSFLIQSKKDPLKAVLIY